MYCPTCQREVAPKSKVDWGGAGKGVGLAVVLVAVASIFFTVGLALLIWIPLLAFTRSRYQYCPICYTPLSKAEFPTEVTSVPDNKPPPEL